MCEVLSPRSLEHEEDELERRSYACGRARKTLGGLLHDDVLIEPTSNGALRFIDGHSTGTISSVEEKMRHV